MSAVLCGVTWMGRNLCTFLRGIRVSGGHFVCVFMWPPHVWRALCTHLYAVSACVDGTLYTFFEVCTAMGDTLHVSLGVVRMAGQHIACIFA